MFDAQTCTHLSGARRAHLIVSHAVDVTSGCEWVRTTTHRMLEYPDWWDAGRHTHEVWQKYVRFLVQRQTVNWTQLSLLFIVCAILRSAPMCLARIWGDRRHVECTFSPDWHILEFIKKERKFSRAHVYRRLNFQLYFCVFCSPFRSRTSTIVVRNWWDVHKFVCEPVRAHMANWIYALHCLRLNARAHKLSRGETKRKIDCIYWISKTTETCRSYLFADMCVCPFIVVRQSVGDTVRPQACVGDRIRDAIFIVSIELAMRSFSGVSRSCVRIRKR